MPLPQALGRFNRRVSNRIMRQVAGFVPPLGIVIHRGRKSGRLYRTPVLAFQQDSTVTFALTYGTDVDWLKNVLDAQECWLIHRSERQALVDPRWLPSEEGFRRMPPPIRLALHAINVDKFIELRLLPDSGDAGEREREHGDLSN